MPPTRIRSVVWSNVAPCCWAAEPQMCHETNNNLRTNRDHHTFGWSLGSSGLRAINLTWFVWRCSGIWWSPLALWNPTLLGQLYSQPQLQIPRNHAKALSAAERLRPAIFKPMSLDQERRWYKPLCHSTPKWVCLKMVYHGIPHIPAEWILKW